MQPNDQYIADVQEPMRELAEELREALRDLLRYIDGDEPIQAEYRAHETLRHAAEVLGDES